MYGDDEQETDPDLEALSKCQKLMEDLTSKFSSIELAEMNFAKDAEYDRKTLKGQANALRVDCMKNVYESLMEYLLTSGADKSVSRAQRVLGLYTRHRDLNELIKVKKNHFILICHSKLSRIIVKLGQT